jgi:hypothetical protein
MAKRVILGQLGAGPDLVLRVSRPGFDAETEPSGSKNIAFDSRLNDFGIFHQRGVWNWGDPIITFPTLPFVPLVTIQRVDSSNRIRVEEALITPNVVGTIPYVATPFVAIVTVSTLEIRQFTIPYYSINFTGLLTKFLYTVFAIETP